MGPQVLIFLIPLSIMTALFVWAGRLRRRRRDEQMSPLNRPTGRVPIGSATAIADAGQVPWRDLLDALAIAPEGEYHEGWMGSMLGLRTKWSTSTSVLEANRIWGERAGRPIRIRLGPDEHLEGSTTMLTNRHIRYRTEVGVSVPPFELAGRDGVLMPSVAVPAAVGAVLAPMAPAPLVWDGVRVTGGADGIVADRPGAYDSLNTWLYDLWLCERLAWALGR